MIAKNSKIILKSFKKELPEIKIIEPFQPDEIIECETKEDFIEIINADIEKYKSMTTQKLNKMFSIPGYRITKLKGEIGLRSDKYYTNKNKNSLCETFAKQNENIHEEEINELKEQIKIIKEAFNQLSEQFEYIKNQIMQSA